MARTFNNRLSRVTHENGGRVFVLFLLFLLALYQFIHAGLNGLMIICILPCLIPIIYVAFNWQMSTFWALIFVNYFVQFFSKQQLLPNGIPMSLYNELIEIVLISIAIVDARRTPKFDRTLNLMFLMLLIWCSFCTLQVLNDTCNLGINIGGWYTGARMMAFQLMYAFIVFILYLTPPKKYINI